MAAPNRELPYLNLLDRESKALGRCVVPRVAHDARCPCGERLHTAAVMPARVHIFHSFQSHPRVPKHS
eukprot:scaffold25495_cov30-Tisochrysis_lutea.AAC.8